jgi:ribosomal protein S18 acetylase RimI-like enzyme
MSHEYESPVRLRRFEPLDTGQVWALHACSITAIPEAHGEDYWADLRDVAHHYIDAGGEFLVGFAGESLVAMGGFRPLSAGEVEIMRMRVHPDRQGRGLGGALLRALEKAARERDYGQVYLETTVVQIAALAMYRSHGYVEVGRTTKAGFEVVQFRKVLAAG